MGGSGARGRIGGLVAAVLLLVVPPAFALDTDIFTGTQVPPNVLIIFDNSGSMGAQAYNVYPTTIYTGSSDPGTMYTRCKSKNGVLGADVNSNCTCRNTNSFWTVDNSSCASSFVDNVPGPAGDDIDDRESRRKRGNRRNFEDNPPKNCTESPFESCTSEAQCPGTSNICSAQNKMAIAKGVMTSAVNNPDNEGVRFGMTVFNPSGINYSTMDYGSSTQMTNWHVNNNVYVFPVQDMTDTSRATLTGLIEGLSANGGTPTVHRLIDAWKYFNGQATKPGWTSPVQETCQRNYMLMVTDGVPEGEGDILVSNQNSCTFNRVKSFVGTTAGGDLNADGKENPSSPNYLATTGEMYNCGSDYLDDGVIKMRGMFPLGDSGNQPVNFYAISFGFDFCEAADAGDTDPGAGSLLWRAAKKYGGGECLTADQPEELDDALREAINLIQNDAQSFVAPVVPVSQTNRTESGDRLYVALFSPREGQQEWPGNIKKYALDKANGTICNATTASPVTCTIGSGAATTIDGTIMATAESFWDASSGGPSGSAVTSGGVGGVLQASNLAQRKIYTYTGTSTGSLSSLDLTATAQAFTTTNGAITPAKLGLTGGDATTANKDAIINYMYGWDTYDADADGVTAEKRNWILGDIIHSVPLIVNYTNLDADPDVDKALIIVGSNDGMLHAFDDESGTEVWSFVPPDVLDKLYLLQPGESATHPFFVDASPKYKEIGGVKYLVFGLGRGGRGYYGLDISSWSAPKLLWRVNNTTTGYSELGYTHSTPAMTQVNSGGTGVPVAVVGGGYDLHFDDPDATANASGMGRAIYAIGLSNGSKVASISGMTYAVPSDPLTFDVNGDGIFDRGYVGDLGGNLWRIEDDFSPTPSKLFSAPGKRIFYAPDAVINAGNVMVFFGTGDRTNPLETGTTDWFFAVRDDGTDNVTEGQLKDVTGVLVQPNSPQRDTLAQQVEDNYQGWRIALAGAGEKMLAPPTVFFNVAFTTFIPSTEVCDAGGTARIYIVDPLLGQPTLDLAGTTDEDLGSGGAGSGEGGLLTLGDRFVIIGNSIPTSLKVTFGDNETKAFFGVTKGGGIALQPLSLPQMAANVIPVSWRQVW
jgi:type IV pilus assembly protein PilY1